MRVVHVPTREEVREERRRRYLAAWPVERQMEALTEAIDGRAEKQKQMLEDFAVIRKALPFYEEA